MSRARRRTPEEAKEAWQGMGDERVRVGLGFWREGTMGREGDGVERRRRVGAAGAWGWAGMAMDREGGEGVA